MSEKPSVNMTPETDGFAARYDRMVERSGGWALKAVVVIVALVVIIGLVLQYAG